MGIGIVSHPSFPDKIFSLQVHGDIQWIGIVRPGNGEGIAATPVAAFDQHERVGIVLLHGQQVMNRVGIVIEITQR